MTRIAISEAAFAEIARTMPLGSVGYENAVNEHGQHYVWLDPAVVDRLGALPGPGESYGDVILRSSSRRDGC
jgi:hypothetical protein